MATKPTATFTHATNLNFSLGPAAGFPTKLPVPDIPNGYVPGTGVSAEQVNGQFNILGDWLTNWLILGSAVASLDAHIVETNAAGETRIATGVFGGTAGAERGLIVNENGGIQSATIFNSNPNGNALEVGATSTIAALISTNNGTGPALQATSGGDAGEFTGGGIGAGIRAQGGPTGPGVSARSEPTSTKPAGEFFGNVFAGPQVRGSIHLQPTPPVPSGPLDGDFWKRSSGGPGNGRGGLEWWDGDGSPQGGAPGKQRAWSTENGLGFQYEEVEGDQTTSVVNPAFATAATLQVGANVSPGDPEGFYIVEWYAELFLAGFPVQVTTRGIVAMFDGAVEIGRQEFDFAALGQVKVFSGMRRRLYNGAVKTFSLQFNTLGPGPNNDVTIRRARIVARGAYEDLVI